MYLKSTIFSLGSRTSRSRSRSKSRGSRSRSGSAASNRSGSVANRKKRAAVLSDSENEGEAAAAAPKRPKIVDTDNEDDNALEGTGENQEGQERGGESSDEGVNKDDGDQGGFVNAFFIQF